jgi:hypothetical protein
MSNAINIHSGDRTIRASVAMNKSEVRLTMRAPLDSGDRKSVTIGSEPT